MFIRIAISCICIAIEEIGLMGKQSIDDPVCSGSGKIVQDVLQRCGVLQARISSVSRQSVDCITYVRARGISDKLELSEQSHI